LTCKNLYRNIQVDIIIKYTKNGKTKFDETDAEKYDMLHGNVCNIIPSCLNTWA